MNKEEKFVPKAPNYKGDGVAVWIDKDKNGATFLKVKVLNMKAVNCFKYEPKPKEIPHDIVDL